jgi:hypothetical protein
MLRMMLDSASRFTAELVRGAIARSAGVPVAMINLDGVRCLASLSVDQDELARRGSSSGPTTTDRRLLSVLWGLPTGGSVGTDKFAGSPFEELHRAGMIEVHGDRIMRTYQPIGQVLSLSFLGSRAVANALAWPPTFERTAFMTAPTRGLLRRANEYGVGVARLTDAGEIDYLLLPRPPVLGRPGLFRWWLAEACFAALTATSVPRL